MFFTFAGDLPQTCRRHPELLRRGPGVLWNGSSRLMTSVTNLVLPDLQATTFIGVLNLYCARLLQTSIPHATTLMQMSQCGQVVHPVSHCDATLLSLALLPGRCTAKPRCAALSRCSLEYCTADTPKMLSMHPVGQGV